MNCHAEQPQVAKHLTNRVLLLENVLCDLGQDKVAAYSWLLLAQAAGGDAQAQATNLEANLNEQEIAEARTRAQSWLDAHRTPHSKVR